MTSALWNLFFKTKNRDQVQTKDTFEETFMAQKNILSWSGICMTHYISAFRSKCWSYFYWFMMLNFIVALSSELVAMIITAKNAKNFEDAVEMFRMMPCFGSVILSIIKSMKIKLNRNVYERIYYELHDMWPREHNDDDQRIIRPAMKSFKITLKGYYWSNNFLLLLFLVPPYIIYLWQYFGYDVNLILSFKFWLPFDPFQPIVYEFILVLQTWEATLVIWLNVAWDMLFCTYLLHITMQLDMLAVRIRKLIHVSTDQQLINSYPLAIVSKRILQEEVDIVNSDNHQNWEISDQKTLVEIAMRHQTIIRLAGDVEAMFSFGLLINFMYSSIIICFCGFCCVLIEKWNEIAYKLYLLVALAQTWLLCWYGQKLLDSSDRLSDAFYESGWYNASKKLKTSILIMLLRSQKAIHVTTYGFSIVSLPSYTTIIKTSWSYFTLLLNIYNTSAEKETNET